MRGNVSPASESVSIVDFALYRHISTSAHQHERACDESHVAAEAEKQKKLLVYISVCGGIGVTPNAAPMNSLGAHPL